MPCPHREMGNVYTWQEVPEAIKLAKEKYLQDRIKRYVYPCSNLACTGLPDSLHLAKVTLGSSRWAERNRPLTNFYEQHETFGKGKSKQKDAAYRAKVKGRKYLNLDRWADDGGALRPPRTP